MSTKKKRKTAGASPATPVSHPQDARTWPCQKCKGACCRYFALPIDTPEDEEDFDDIRWYLCHKHTRVFVEDDVWYLEIQTRCKYLTPSYRCAIYESRPHICSDYGKDEDGEMNCHMSDSDFDFEHEFNEPEDIERYARRVLRKRRLSWEKPAKHKKPKKK